MVLKARIPESEFPPLSTPSVPTLSRLRVLFGEYVALTKPRIISLLLLVTLTAMLVAAGRLPPLLEIMLTLIGGGLMAAAANVLNCYLDRDLDRKMSRTRKRPLVTGTIAPANALRFGISLALCSFLTLGIGVNLLSALLAFSGLLVYVLLYTPWKRNSPASVLIGSVAGAMPPLVAWAAVTGSLNFNALLLFAIMAVWQIPHTLALTLFLYNDYSRADVPVLPVARGIQSTQRQILVYSTFLLGLTLVPSVLGFLGPLYGLGAFLLGVRFIQLAYAELRSLGVRNDLHLYKFSLLYLALLFALMTADRFIHVLGHG